MKRQQRTTETTTAHPADDAPRIESSLPRWRLDLTTQLTLDSSVEDVWQTLTALSDYAAWNPFIISAGGVLALGERLDLTIRPPGGRAMSFRPRVTAVRPYQYLEWLGRLGMPGIFDGRHSFTLTPVTGGRTLLEQSERFTGVLVPFTSSMLGRTREGFAQMNEALGRQSRATRP